MAHLMSQTRGYQYFITFTDEQSWYRYMYVRYKFEDFKRFKEFRYELEKKIKKKILKVLRSDGGCNTK